jgi:hypothetical protein
LNRCCLRTDFSNSNRGDAHQTLIFALWHHDVFRHLTVTIV